MVPGNKLPQPREELLDRTLDIRRDDEPSLTQERELKVSQRTLDEMFAGRAAIAAAAADQCAASGKLMLEKRYGDQALPGSRYIFRTTVSKSAVEENFFVKLEIFDRHIPSKNAEPIFEDIEPARKFISELLLTKIIMVCG